MRACPITLEPLEAGEIFSKAALRSLHPRLMQLEPLALSQEEQLRQARLRADKMSIQGVQPKLSAVLKPKEGCFKVVDSGGRFILKPNPPPYEEVPANEALSMTLAKHAGIEVPSHGLLPAVDGSWVYMIRRFDRTGRDGRLHVEDFAQLSGATRDTKYASSLEQVAKLVETHCSFPAIEKAVLARRLLFCFLIGNEDMHLKNFSLLVEKGKIRMAPAYDFLNSTLVLENATEESALPLRGRINRVSPIGFTSKVGNPNKPAANSFFPVESNPAAGKSGPHEHRTSNIEHRTQESPIASHSSSFSSLRRSMFSVRCSMFSSLSPLRFAIAHHVQFLITNIP